MTIFMPADLSRGMLSGGGASTKFTCPDNNAATRVDASGIGIRIMRSCLGTRLVSQCALFGTSSNRSRGIILSYRYGPVPEGCVA